MKKNFADVSIEYVNCPDLTQEPFNLAPPGERSIEHLEVFVLKAQKYIHIFLGLCNRTALIYIGDSEYVIPENLDPKMIKTYYIKNILRQLGRNKNALFSVMV